MEEMRGPPVWRGNEMAVGDDWIVNLDSSDCDEIFSAAKSLEGRALQTINKADFNLPRTAAKLAAIRDQIGSGGRGFAMLRGLKADPSDPLLETAFWGIGAHVGTGVSQSTAGDILGHVYDRGNNDKVRYYRRGGPLEFHIDPVDATGLLCLRSAREGGASRIASAAAVHNVIRSENPEALALLYRGFFNSLRGHGIDAVTRKKLPIFVSGPNGLECNYLVGSILQAAGQGIPISEEEQRALTLVNEIASRPGIYLDMEFQEGDIQFLSNRTVMHARTDYVDHAAPDLKRHLLRLWLMIPNWPSRAAGAEFFGAAPDRAGGGVRPVMA